ncbi:MAG: hypothetical protein Q4A47_01455 [Erysipelotrichaceae bacterium]|nr:hypothetical protein [Erysipelotrichaceae bacterium]
MKKEQFFNYISYLLILILFYVLLPLGIKDTGSGMFILIGLLPILVFLLSIVFGIKNGVQWHFSVLVALLWIPFIYFYFNDSAMVYAAIYGVLSLVGQWIGSFFKK